MNCSSKNEEKCQFRSKQVAWLGLSVNLAIVLGSFPSLSPSRPFLPTGRRLSRCPYRVCKAERGGQPGGEKERRQRQELTPKPFSDLLFQACPLESERRLVSDASWMKTDLKSVRRDTYCIVTGGHAKQGGFSPGARVSLPAFPKHVRQVDWTLQIVPGCEGERK